MKKILLRLFSFVFIFSFLVAPSTVLAVTEDELLWGGKKSTVMANSGLGNQDPRAVISNVIRTILGFLGIIAVVIILMGGFKWMTAGGNEETVTQARGNIKNAIIGLVVVFLSFVIVNFTVNQLTDATGAGDASPPPGDAVEGARPGEGACLYVNTRWPIGCDDRVSCEQTTGGACQANRCGNAYWDVGRTCANLSEEARAFDPYAEPPAS